MGREKEEEKIPASPVLVSPFLTIVNLALTLMRAICSLLLWHNRYSQLCELNLYSQSDFSLVLSFFLVVFLSSLFPLSPLFRTFIPSTLPKLYRYVCPPRLHKRTEYTGNCTRTTMSTLLRPQFFCTRPNGTLTPVIAVDELPAHLSIRGAPRVLSPNETQGMTSLGTVAQRGQLYTVEGAVAIASRPSSTGDTNHRSRNHDMQSSLMRILADENLPYNQRMALSMVLQQGFSQNWQVNNPPAPGWMVPNNGGTSSPGGGSGQQVSSSALRVTPWWPETPSVNDTNLSMADPFP